MLVRPAYSHTTRLAYLSVDVRRSKAVECTFPIGHFLSKTRPPTIKAALFIWPRLASSHISFPHRPVVGSTFARATLSGLILVRRTSSSLILAALVSLEGWTLTSNLVRRAHARGKAAAHRDPITSPKRREEFNQF